MINIGQFRQFILVPALKQIGLYSLAAEQLLMGTAMTESGFMHLRQLARRDGRRGPARGLFQMEPATHRSLWRHFLGSPRRRQLKGRLQHLVVSMQRSDSGIPQADQLVWNLAYAAAMARIKYYSIPEALPAANDVEGLASYWKRYYNTVHGAGRVRQFISDYHEMRELEKRTAV